jgi:serine protease Do
MSNLSLKTSKTNLKNSINEILIYLYGMIIICGVCVALFVGMTKTSSHALASSMVRVENNIGHGSGVYIGNGYVLTAAHVIQDPDFPIKVEGKSSVIDSLGKHHNIEVLWLNHTYDVSLIRIDHPSDIASSYLSCRIPHLSEKLSFSGYPFTLPNITMFGRVASSKIITVGPWKAVTVVSGQIAPGMSGGPAFDASGNLIGINVGVMQNFAMSFIVPSHTICMLMDRAN